MHWGDTGLDDHQIAFVLHTLPDAVLVADDSWGLLDTRVLHVVDGDVGYTVKASGQDNTHFPRELDAHRTVTDDLCAAGDTGALVAADEQHRVLILERVPGYLALGTPDEHAPDVHRQAGAVLRRLHDHGTRHDPTFLLHEQAKAFRALDTPHRISSDVVARTRAALEMLPTDHPDEPLVPTHGDFHPRNWIVDDEGDGHGHGHGHGRLRVIDFGRFGWRPASFDLTRLAVLHWQDDPALEAAFFDGYGDDPRESDAWRWLQLREAVGTATWAYAVGDEGFEAQGHDMLRRALTAF
ncbi:phosphotransferase family enzyme [Curtobacterium sp. PhB25]|uniref:phosphotransferase n=1 Tax=unclassified Curtobacterium TaxID=257496 RepID=UPI00104D9A69|nr:MULTISPECIES: aminoglycoside phosphotransferase family protein [unclassified Curtobacterium]TCU87753.1 phosphotransferase family enzyme [Curtobacterium sp. PhB191]TDW46158.1 phosphotransferase family enzyme [Curtobacterium sp. PhB42]TDW55564.1 phosphotransferase family enzyme [Curtobacterium sp. PhB190]TDW72929.1 phosphotransferase family enzyme [Curtobacterium sp. PhB25]